nr:RimK-like ATP-grasp domain protein [uncultured bacterium]
MNNKVARTAMTPGAPGTHYPFVTRLVMELVAQDLLPNIATVQIEPMFGHVGRLVYRDGRVRFFRNTSLGINNLGASEISRDKGYTKYFLELLGYSTPRGKVFLFRDFLRILKGKLSRYGVEELADADAAPEWVQSIIGYPCYVKRNDSSQGRGVERCGSVDELVEALARLRAQGLQKVLIEESIALPDYRVVVLGEEVISCYRRLPLTVVGNGVSSIERLMAQKQELFCEAGRDTVIDCADSRISRKLKRHGLSMETVLGEDVSFELHDISNLSAGGEAEDVLERMHASWRELCVSVTARMGLFLCGVDLFCEDISKPDKKYSILELNAAPGLDNYAASGTCQAEVVRSLYRKVLNSG